MSRKGQISLRGQKYLERLFCLCQRRTDCAAAVDSVWKGDIVVCYVCVKGTDYASAIDGIWIDILVVRFLPLSFYAKKKVVERKARIRGIAPRYATLLFGAVSPLYIPL